jgi:hypothetical protein
VFRRGRQTAVTQTLADASYSKPSVQGWEVIHKVQRGQVRWVKKGDIRGPNRFIGRALGFAG